MQEVFMTVLPPNLLECSSPPGIEAATMAIMEALQVSAQAAVPSKVIKLKGPSKKLSPGLAKKLKENKEVFYIWKWVGCPPPSHPRSIERTKTKRAVRQQQRADAADERRFFYEQVMADVNNTNFHKLIKRQRSTTKTSSAIVINGELCSDQLEQVEAWVTHFETLGTPKD
jgi:hypothetical protein